MGADAPVVVERLSARTDAMSWALSEWCWGPARILRHNAGRHEASQQYTVGQVSAASAQEAPPNPGHAISLVGGNRITRPLSDSTPSRPGSTSSVLLGEVVHPGTPIAALRQRSMQRTRDRRESGYILTRGPRSSESSHGSCAAATCSRLQRPGLRPGPSAHGSIQRKPRARESGEWAAK
jgi:hypothetical protein